MVKSSSLHHPLNVYHVFVGSVGFITFSLISISTIWLSTKLQLFVSNVTVLHADAGFTNQLSATPHLHGWLSEKVSLSVNGTVTHDTMSDTFLFSV